MKSKEENKKTNKQKIYEIPGNTLLRPETLGVCPACFVKVIKLGQPPCGLQSGQKKMMAGTCNMLLGLKDSVEQGLGHAPAMAGAMRCAGTPFHQLNRGLT